MGIKEYDYILEVIADGWDRPAYFGLVDDHPTLGYRIVKSRTPGSASSHGYNTVHVFPIDVTTHCPNAPDCTHGEIGNLVESDYWKGL